MFMNNKKKKQLNNKHNVMYTYIYKLLEEVFKQV